MPYLNKEKTKLLISVGGRSSPLSQIQIQEVLNELRQYHPDVEFDIHLVMTVGDHDQKTSLRTLNQTNFFTKEVDELVLNQRCRIGIHSAKDLPNPLPDGIELICLTKGIDSSDSLVLREGETINSLPKGSKIATSSERREETVKQLRSDLTFRDLRGNIGQRLALLDQGEADGIVVAEAALIRLGLSHLNRIRLPGETVAGQGQLAILAREDDEEMKQLFACMDIRKVN